MEEKKTAPRPDPHQDDKRKEELQQQMRSMLTYVIGGLLVLWLFQEFVLNPLAVRAVQIPYSTFKSKLADHQIVSVVIGQEHIEGEMKNPEATRETVKGKDRDATPTASERTPQPTVEAAGAQAKDKDTTPTVPFDTVPIPTGDPNLVDQLQAAGVKYEAKQPPSPIGSFLIAWVLPLVVVAGLWSFFSRRMRAGGGAGPMGGLFGVGRSKATVVSREEVRVTYKDVGGADEAIAELEEIIQFLTAPEQFAALGGRTPKGVLLVGPPGTGKTLLAKATAGEAGVAFFETSGSEFVEMFVGVGAARVRDMFEQARRVAPAIIFVDEIDAIGQSRGGAVRLGGNDEREQTLNQLLAEIDGFKTEAGSPVIIMAATNRPEVLDPALMRAGRFDRQIVVGNPDLAGRQQILRIHSRTVKLAGDFDLDRAARITPGFSGADLANVINEAALLAARRRAEAVGMADFEAAIERVVAGLERRTRVMNEKERTAVAYHESGHALVAELVPHGDPVAKVSIVPRSRGALGYTLQMPTEDRFLLTVEELLDRIAVMMAGRAAEQVVFDTISTGASDDIMRATELARRMVTEFGMSEALGSVRLAGQQVQFLGGVLPDSGQLSPSTQETIDTEVRRLVTEQYERAQELLSSHRAALEQLTHELLRRETLDGSEVKKALGKE